MKKLIAVTAFILIFSISCSLFIFAAETPPVLLQISDASVYAGSSARVKVQIKNTGNMKECIFALEYDKEQLEYVKFIKSGQNISIADDEQEGLVTFTVKQGGTFAKAVNFTLEFKLKETLSSLANSLKISLKSVTDGNNAPVGATATSGGIILKPVSYTHLREYELFRRCTYKHFGEINEK